MTKKDILRKKCTHSFWEKEDFYVLTAALQCLFFLLGMLHHTQSLSVQGVHLQMCMAVSVFKEWVIHHCSSCGDIFCLKFNLHLFQRCHKNAYKEQAHDLDLQWLHSPQNAVAFKGVYRPAGDNSQDCSKREGKGHPCLHAGEPIEKDACSLLFTMEFLHLPKVLMVTTMWWGPPEAFSVFWGNAELHHAWATSQWSSHGLFPKWQPSGEQAGSELEITGTYGRCSYPSTWIPLQTQSYREQAHEGSQIHAHINCKDEAVQYSNIKSVRF